MKISLFIIICLFISASLLSGQTRISIYAGYGFSQFDDDIFASDQIDQTGYLPAGASIEFGRDMYTFGIEGNYSVLPFTFDLRGCWLGLDSYPARGDYITPLCGLYEWSMYNQ